MSIHFQVIRPNNQDIVANVGQRGYALAHGPKGNIRYLGTMGLLSCIAVGLVLRKTGEKYPRIAFGHFDTQTDMPPSFRALFDGIGYRKNETATMYLMGGEQPKAETVFRITRLLFSRRVIVKNDFTQSGKDEFVLDLANGSPVLPRSCKMLHRYGVSPEELDDRMNNNKGPDVPLILEIDMRKVIPRKGFILSKNSANPIENPALHVR